jgi:hypothetical protein
MKQNSCLSFLFPKLFPSKEIIKRFEYPLFINKDLFSSKKKHLIYNRIIQAMVESY